jgi:hypothetical protein
VYSISRRYDNHIFLKRHIELYHRVVISNN